MFTQVALHVHGNSFPNRHLRPCVLLQASADEGSFDPKGKYMTDTEHPVSSFEDVTPDTASQGHSIHFYLINDCEILGHLSTWNVILL